MYPEPIIHSSHLLSKYYIHKNVQLGLAKERDENNVDIVQLGHCGYGVSFLTYLLFQALDHIAILGDKLQLFK